MIVTILWILCALLAFSSLFFRDAAGELGVAVMALQGVIIALTL